MRAPTMLITTALTVATAVLLTACGGSGAKPSGSGAIKGAQSTATPSPSPSAASGVKRLAVSLPAGARDVFEGLHTGDPKKDAILADNALAIESVDQQILFRNPKLPALPFYETGNALVDGAKYIEGYLKNDDTWYGTVRFFDRKVTLSGDGSASVIYCSDETKATLKHLKTGKTDNSPVSSQDYVLYNTRLVKNSQGVWQTAEIISQRGAKECQP